MQFEAAEEFIMNKLRNELPEWLSYHSVAHIRDVYGAAEMIAAKEGISDYERTLLLTAVLFHDSGFLIQQKDHEKLSTEIASEYLPRFGYNAEEISRICSMIMATAIPQSPQNLLEEILCDADLDYLGRDDFFAIGNKLFTELRIYGLLKNERDWNKLQISFLEGHHYFTNTALALRKQKKDEHLVMLREKEAIA